VRDLKVLGWQIFYPVTLAALARFSLTEMPRLLHLIEVIIVRHLLTMSGSTGKLETSAAILAGKIYSCEIDTATQAFQELKDYYPSDHDFKQFFATKSENSNQKAQYLLRCIEMEAIRQQQQKTADELSPGMLTIEHILPRNPGDKWSSVIINDPNIVDDCSIRVGNMCLLPECGNVKAGGQEFAEKKKVFEKSLLITTRAVAEHSDWNRQSIDHHQAYLAKLAATAWRFS
jgi:Protein of unknown function (DUF1524)